MASLGFDVIGVDVDPEKIALLQKGEIPFYEPGLDTLLAEQVKSGRLTFTSNFSDISDCDIHFLCVGTPQVKDGLAADLTYVNASLEAVGAIAKDGALVVGKSTVPVGTADRLRTRLAEINPKAVPFLNRLSDFFFVASRWVVFAQKASETTWKKTGGLKTLTPVPST